MSEFPVYPLDEPPHACMYLPGLTAQFESYMIPEPTHDGFVHLLERGFRHFGPYFFRPACPGVVETDIDHRSFACADSWCGACLPLRISVPDFVPSAAQRRVLRNGLGVRMQAAAPQCDARRHAIYQAHNERFAPLPNGAPKQDLDYETFSLSFYSGSPFTRECTYYLAERLIAFSLLDIAAPLASSIYCAFDPQFEALSLGTLSVLREIEHAHALGLQYYYLGYTMQANRSLAYKQAFRPSEYFTGSQWQPLRDANGGWKQQPQSLRTHPSERLISE